MESVSELSASLPSDAASPSRRDAVAASHTAVRMGVGVVFTASGAAALIYEVLWLKQLGLLFGNTAQAAAATLAVFFLGLSLGARICGERAARTANPLRAFAALEVAVAASALLFFALFEIYAALYRPLAALLHESPGAFAAAKLLLASGILLPAAFCMGGTLPFMSQHMVRRRDELGATVSWLYACNTIGGALGAFSAGFLLTPALGMTRSYTVAIALNLSVAAIAWSLSRRSAAAPPTPAPAHAVVARSAVAVLPAAVACFSGAATLGLEVQWTRMFAQVLHNSVYSFAAILVTFLVAMAAGAALATRLCRSSARPELVLPWLLVAAGLGAGTSPFVFHRLTGGLHYLAPASDWWAYVGAVFGAAAAVLLLPGICLGTVFPYLLKVAGGAEHDGAGSTVGRLAAWNAVGSIAGSLLSGFVLIEWLGLWAAIRAIALAYLGLAVLLLPAGAPRLRAAVVAVMAAVVVVFDPGRLPLVRAGHGELVRETWETGHAIVTVVQSAQHLAIKLDNFYSLGGTSARTYEEAQADIPLIIHPAPRRALFLGLGTGITAGAALRHNVEQLTVCELIPEVVTAARRHFGPYVNKLFEDPRTTVLVEDGRQHLLATEQRYDVIVSDLFIPWQAGTGSLYTREHFELARARLAPGGLFAQWLPLYQLSERDALVIMRTMLEVFPQVTLWRGDFMPDHSIVALIGQEAGAQLDPEAITANFRHRRQTDDMSRELAMAFTGLFYAGNLTANRDRFAGAAINTDDMPLIEYQAPIAQREQAGGARPWFISFPLAQFEAALFRAIPPARDPYLARLTPEEREFALAGMDLFSAILQREAGNSAEAERHAASFRAHVPAQVYTLFRRELEPAADSRKDPDPS
jgi:spermidine synthase